MENVVADHLSRLTIVHNTHNPPINDEFPQESLLLVEKEPLYANIANYLATGELLADWKSQDKKFFFAKIHSYYWEEPFLYKYCADQIIRRCVPEAEQQGIISHWHENACGGHFAFQKTARKVFVVWIPLALSFQGCPYHVQGMRKMPKFGEDFSPSHDAFKPDFGS